jgi:hypothetical protein
MALITTIHMLSLSGLLPVLDQFCTKLLCEFLHLSGRLKKKNPRSLALQLWRNRNGLVSKWRKRAPLKKLGKHGNNKNRKDARE